MADAEARFNKSLRPRKPEGSLGRTAQDVHLDSHTAPELSLYAQSAITVISGRPGGATGHNQVQGIWHEAVWVIPGDLVDNSINCTEAFGTTTEESLT